MRTEGGRRGLGRKGRKEKKEESERGSEEKEAQDNVACFTQAFVLLLIVEEDKVQVLPLGICQVGMRGGL